MGLSTRRVEIGGIASSANGLWMSQIARNLTDAMDGLLTDKRYLIHDRDPLYTTEFLGILADAGIQSVKLPPRSRNLNAYAERFVHTIKEACLDRMICLVKTRCGTRSENSLPTTTSNETTRDSIIGSSFQLSQPLQRPEP